MVFSLRNDKELGFTIVELLIVVVVVAILATISIVAYTGIQDRSRNAVVVHNLSNTAKALEMFNAEFGHYPANGSEYTKMRSALVLTETKSNTLLYCVDTSAPNAWTLMAGRYPTKSSIWNSAGLHDDNNAQGVGSGTTTCQAVTGNPNVTGLWAFNIATIQ